MESTENYETATDKLNKLKDTVDNLDKKINEIVNECDKTLGILNEKAKKNHSHVKDVWSADLSYYHEIARHAWGVRGKKIAILEMQEELNQLRSLVNGNS